MARVPQDDVTLPVGPALVENEVGVEPVRREPIRPASVAPAAVLRPDPSRRVAARGFVAAAWATETGNDVANMSAPTSTVDDNRENFITSPQEYNLLLNTLQRD